MFLRTNVERMRKKGYMVNIPLSQSALTRKIICTFKYSKGQEKRVKINNSVFVGPTLAIHLNPNINEFLFDFSQGANGSLVFTQSECGNIRLNVSLDITVQGTSVEPENFIEVSRVRYKNKRVLRDSFFVPLEIQI